MVLRSTPFTGGVEYSIDITGADGREHVGIVDRVPSTFSDATVGNGSGGGGGLGGGADTGGGGGQGTGGGSGRGRVSRSAVVVLRLVADLQRAIVPFLSADHPAVVDDDGMTLSLKDPAFTPGQARVEDRAARWFASPTFSGDVSQTALLRIQGRAQLDANWSNPLFRVFGTSWAGFTFLSAPGPREKDPAQTFGYAIDGLDVTGASVLGGGWSVGVEGRVTQAPDQNWLLRASGYTGVEWVLVPFLATNGGNVGVRYVIGTEHQEYVHENVEKSFEGNFLRHRLVAFGVWHFERVDLSASLAGSSIVKDFTYSDVSAAASVAWRVVNDLSVSLSTTASYRNALVNAPDNLNELDPLERFVGGGNFGAVNYTASLSLVYVLGNSLLERQDQRWSNGTEQ